MLYINGIKCETSEELEVAIVDFDEYQKECARNDFNGIPNAPILQLVPESVTPRQLRIALFSIGITESIIDAMLNSLPDPTKTIARITWDYSTLIYRNNPILEQMAPSLGFTTQQVDDLFIAAEKL